MSIRDGAALYNFKVPPEVSNEHLEELGLEVERDWLGRTNRLGAALQAEGKPDLSRVERKA